MNNNGSNGSVRQGSQIRGKSSAHLLMNKVVLLIGNDAGALHSLAVQFATLGGDVVLASPHLSIKVAESIRQKVLQIGGQFLFMDRHLVNNFQKAEAIVEYIRRELGGIDILIDISSDHNGEQINEAYPSTPTYQWWLSSAILNELVR